MIYSNKINTLIIINYTKNIKSFSNEPSDERPTAGKELGVGLPTVATPRICMILGFLAPPQVELD